MIKCPVCNEEVVIDTPSVNVKNLRCLNDCYQEYLEENDDCNSEFYLKVNGKEFRVIGMKDTKEWHEQLINIAEHRDRIIV